MSSLFNDTEEDLPLRPRGMGEHGAQDFHAAKRQEPERELTLSTGTVLLLFFALAALCAVFFGFGYSTGRKSVQTTAASAATAAGETDAGTVAVAAGTKPASTVPATPVPGYVGPGGASATSAERPRVATEKPSAADAGPLPEKRPVPAKRDETATTVLEDAPARSAPERSAGGKPMVPAPVVRVPPAPAAATVAPAPGSIPISPAGSMYVQIVAVSHQEDANVVMAALRRRGYAVTQRSTNTDPLIHVQIGPFATRKDAEAMRARLSGDGYNAILK